MSSDHDASLNDMFTATAAPPPPPRPPVSGPPKAPRSDRRPGDNYFVKVTTPVTGPVAGTTTKGTGVRRRGWLLIVTAIIVLVLGGVALLFTALRAPEVGAEEDLGAQIDGLQLPTSLIELDEYYVADCPGTCPSLVRWFDATAPVEVIRAEIISHMNAAGVELNENSASNQLFSGRDETYIYFVVLDANMIGGNRYAPPGAKAEISVQVLDPS